MMIMSEKSQFHGKGPINLESVAAAVEDLLYQADVPKGEFSSFLQGALAEKQKQQQKRGGKQKDSGECQNTFEKFNCSFEDLFGSDIGAFQDSIHFFAASAPKKRIDLISSQGQQQPVDEDESFSSSSSASYIFPPKNDTAPGNSTRAKELARQREKAVAAKTSEEKPISSPIKVKQRVSVKSLGRLNSPRRRTRAIRADTSGASSVRGAPETEELSLDLMEDSSERNDSSENKGSSGDLMNDQSVNQRRAEKVVVSSSRGKNDFEATCDHSGKDERNRKNSSDRSLSPRRTSQHSQSPRRRTTHDGTESPRKKSPRDNADSPRRRSRRGPDDDDIVSVRSKFTVKRRSPQESTDETVHANLRSKSRSAPTLARSDDRSVSPCRRSTQDGSQSPRRRPRNHLPEDDTKSVRSKLPSSKQRSKRAKETASLSPRRMVQSANKLCESSKIHDEEHSVLNRKPTMKKCETCQIGMDFSESSDPMKSLMRKMSVKKPSPRRKDKQLSISDHASPPSRSSSNAVKKVDPLSKSDHVTRKRLDKTNVRRVNFYY